MNAVINSIGIYHPEKKVYNSFFEERLDTSDKWIKERTGIESRFFAASDEYTSDMCVKAALNLSETYGKDLSDVDFIIVATTTPDHIIPSVASQVQTRIERLSQDVEERQTQLDMLKASLPERAQEMGMVPQEGSISIDLNGYQPSEGGTQ